MECCTSELNVPPKPLTDGMSYAKIGAENLNRNNRKELEMKMEKIRGLILDEPGLYLLGVLVSATLLAFGFTPNQVATILFWWFFVIAVPVGLYITFCDVLVLLLEKKIADETTPGWNLENRPSLQELKKTNPEQARWMGEMHDMLDQINWHGGMIQLILTISVFVGLVVGAFFFKSFVINSGWWRLALAVILLGYGFVMHSNKVLKILSVAPSPS